MCEKGEKMITLWGEASWRGTGLLTFSFKVGNTGILSSEARRELRERREESIDWRWEAAGRKTSFSLSQHENYPARHGLALQGPFKTALAVLLWLEGMGAPAWFLPLHTCWRWWALLGTSALFPSQSLSLGFFVGFLTLTCVGFFFFLSPKPRTCTTTFY